MDPPHLPPPHHAGGDPPGGLAITADTATTYTGLYRARNDPLNGDYGPWLSGHAVEGNTPAAIRELMLNTPDSVPKVYLVLVPGTRRWVYGADVIPP